MYVDDVEVEKFGDLQVSYNCSGMGTSGICMTCFTFSVPKTVWKYRGGAEVILSGAGTLPKFYISNHSDSKGKTTYTCYDRIMFADTDFPIEGIAWSKDRNGVEYLTVSGVMSLIAGQCGISLNIPGVIQDLIPIFKREQLEGKSCRQVMEDIANAACGYFITQVAAECDNAKLVLFGSSEKMSYPAEKHTSVMLKGQYYYTRVVVTDGTDKYASGSDETGDRTLTINTPFASRELCGEIADRAVYYEYKGFSCEKALMPAVVDPPAAIDFASGESLRINSCTEKISSAGVLLQCGSNPVDDSFHYVGYYERELHKRLESGDFWKNFTVSKSGGFKYKYVNENKTRSNNNEDEEDNDPGEYGFKVEKGGFTGYDGVMSSEKAVTSISVDKDAGTVTCTFEDGHIYEYHADVTETEDGFEITDEGDEWT